jgi:hypothetical protein
MRSLRKNALLLLIIKVKVTTLNLFIVGTIPPLVTPSQEMPPAHIRTYANCEKGDYKP